MRALVLSTLGVTAAAIAVIGLTQNRAGDLTGLWSHRGTPNERVRPHVELQPYGYPGYGAISGASMGGGPAASMIVTDLAPGKVGRHMTLTVQPGGDAVWRIEQRELAGADCLRTLMQTRTGQVKAEGGQLILQIEGGSERIVSTCVTPERALTSRGEAYRLHRNRRLLSLTSEGLTWTLSRG